MAKRTMPGRNGGTLKVGGNNGGGRPRKLPLLTELIDRVLGEEGEDGVTAAEQIVKELTNRAKAGDEKAAKLILAYAYGQPKQTIEHSGPDGGPIQGIEVTIKTRDDA